MRQTRLSRCLRLVTMLASRIRYSLKDLACEFEVSKRTIYRDLCLLAESGFHVQYDAKSHCYILLNRSSICTSELSDAEITILLLVAHIFSLSCDHEVSRSVHQAISKLLNQIPAVLRDEIAGLLNSVGGKPSPALWPEGKKLVINEILVAIGQKRPIRIIYHLPEGDTPPVQTKITPHQLIAAQGRWYLVGRSSLHRKVCRFDVQHIQHAVQTDESTSSPNSSLHRTRSRNQLLIPAGS
jgi:predicted DNA-binding transcriptional regulator YafY